MRKNLFIALTVCSILIAACSPSTTVPTNTSTSANTPLPTTTSTLMPLPTSTFGLTLGPNPTASLAVSATSTVLSPTPVTTPTSPSSWQPVTGLAVGETFTFASCTGITPVQFTGTITTNDSATVEYDWLLRWGKNNTQNNTYSTPTQNVNFTTAGTKTVKSASDYNASCERYAVSLHIIYPNYMIATKYFSIP
ncbi:MAG: hypothetical protein WCA79_04720 [Anaerolineales bacterium]